MLILPLAAIVHNIKVTFQVYDTASGPAVKLMSTDNIQTFFVTNFIISNTSNGTVTVSVYLVPPGGVAANTNAVLLGYKLTGNNYVEGHGGFVVQPGGWSVYVSCDSGNAAVFTLSGILSAQVPDSAVS